MKNTRLIFTTAFITLAIFGTLFYTSCKKDPCSGVSCLNGGTCSNGTCTCPSGWSGTNCDDITAEIFTGIWTGNNCEGNTSYHIYEGGISGGAADSLVLAVPYTFPSCGGDTTISLEGAFGTASFVGTNTVSFSDRCGNQHTMSAVMDINASNSASPIMTITINLNINGATTQCVFTGTK